MSIANMFKGWIGEKAVQLGMWMKLDGNDYKRFHNIIIQTTDGTTKIDHVLLSVYGIFVIETKNYKGWIYGGAMQKQWTQVLFGKKSQFQNPLHQNYRHTKSLSEYLKVEHRNIHSIVVFVGEDVQLKSEFPQNVLTGGLSSYVKSFKKIVFSEAEVKRFGEQLGNVKDNQNILTTYTHIKSVRSKNQEIYEEAQRIIRISEERNLNDKAGEKANRETEQEEETCNKISSSKLAEKFGANTNELLDHFVKIGYLEIK